MVNIILEELINNVVDYNVAEENTEIGENIPPPPQDTDNGGNFPLPPLRLFFPSPEIMGKLPLVTTSQIVMPLSHLCGSWMRVTICGSNVMKYSKVY